MAEFKPGTLAVATVRGVPDVRVIRTEFTIVGKPYQWMSADGMVGDFWHHEDGDVTDVRPLLVLDPVAANPITGPGRALEHLLEVLEGNSGGYLSTAGFAQQVREQIKPPRIPEPGMWGVVEASLSKNRTRVQFVRTKYGWTRVGGSARGADDFAWESLIDPVLIRLGVDD